MIKLNNIIKNSFSFIAPKIKFFFPDRYFIIGAFIFIIFCWNATGTLAPYANTSKASLTCTSCDYLINVDHFNFLATFNLIDGKPKYTYENSVVLRRFLFPFLAYPFMKFLGFYYGGILASIIINFLVIFGFSVWIYRSVGKVAGLSTLLLLITMPGTFYWIGLPYSYTLIVPSTLVLYYLLSKISRTNRLISHVFYCLLIGLIFLAYDLWIFFLPALLMIFAFQNWKRIWIAFVCLLPTFIWNYTLSSVFNITFSNSNTDIYSGLIDAYLIFPQNHFDYSYFTSYLEKICTVLFSVGPKIFLYSNFIALPLLFLIGIVFNYFIKSHIHLLLIEKVILLSVVVVFLFINLTFKQPKGWNLSGDWIARLYQPVFVVYVAYLARTTSALTSYFLPKIKYIYFYLASLAIAFNIYIMFGIWIESNFTSKVYYFFYKHSTQTAQIEMIRKYGKKPIGFCNSFK